VASVVVIGLSGAPGAAPASAQVVPTPEEHLGHRVGDDYRLAKWQQIVDYFQIVGDASARVAVHTMGATSEGRPMIYAEISAPETMAELDRHKENQRRLSDPRLLADADERRLLAAESKVVLLVSCSIHGSEVGATQMALELLHRLATEDSAQVREILERTIVVLVPSANPDGLDIVADWYFESLGEPWEGRGLPWLYQKYAGHDNNRDWFMLNLPETRHETELIYETWRPTIVWDVHQMGNQGARLFVPPFHDPKNPNVPPLIDQTLLIIGGHMAQTLSREGRKGVVHGAIYDNWWAGGFRTTVYRHNMVGILTEMASVNVASPVFQRKSSLRGARRGLPEYEIATNFPEPWPGGWWRLRDIVDYELSIAMSLFTYAARYHDVLQDNLAHLGLEALERGRSEPPVAWLVPPEQRDPGSTRWMLDVLQATGIEIHRATAPFEADGVAYPAGTWILWCEQPYRAHLMDMMERQQYPDRALYPGGPAEPPYDTAGWTLPLQMGVRRVAVSAGFDVEAELVGELPAIEGGLIGGAASHYLVPAGRNDDFRLLSRLSSAGIDYSFYAGSEDWSVGGRAVPPGSILIEDGASMRRLAGDLLAGLAVEPLALSRVPQEIRAQLRAGRAPRIGLYQPWGGSMDEGWTRYVLDHFEIDYATVHNADVRAGNLAGRYDVLVFPSIRPDSLVDGMALDATAPRYAGGLGPEGVVALQDFAKRGGTVVLMDAATGLALDYFNVPLSNVVRGRPSEEFYCPGSILRVELDRSQPVAWGLPDVVSAYFARSQAFELGAESSGAVELTSGGRSPQERFPTRVVGRYADTLLRLVLLGFRVQHRAQSHGTFRLLFNSLHRSILP
jgi:hypothetical protein